MHVDIGRRCAGETTPPRRPALAKSGPSNLAVRPHGRRYITSVQMRSEERFAGQRQILQRVSLAVVINPRPYGPGIHAAQWVRWEGRFRL
jgi:hypothetical protein